MNSDVVGVEKVDSLEAGQRILCGNQWVRVSRQLADAFRPGDSLVALQEMGELLHIASADLKVADTAVSEAAEAFTALAHVGDEQISLFYKKFSELLADNDLFHHVQVANEEDVEAALAKGRSVTRLRIDEKMQDLLHREQAPRVPMPFQVCYRPQNLRPRNLFFDLLSQPLWHQRLLAWL